ncbi:MAG: fibronectin type III domain-containing protein [Nitrospirota bacterium]
MLKLGFKNQSQKRSQGLTFSPLPETRRGKLLPLALSLFFFILCLLNANTVLAASVTLTWDAPTTNSDNTALTDLSGYRVYMSTTSGQYNSGNIVKNNIPASSSTGGVTETTTVDNLTNGTYYFIVTAYDIYGNESGNSNEIQKTTTGGDTQAPTVPTGLSAQAISSSQINLSWTASTDNVGVTGYIIYRCLGSNCTPTTQIATSTTNSYSNTGLSASTTYTYAVSAYDAAGNVSSPSNSTSATTSSGGGGDTQTPTVSTGLSAQAISSSQINLSWTASTDNVGVTGYSIYRDGALIDTSATNSYSNIGLSASTAYTYTVSAYDAAGNVSSQSASASATTSNSSGGNPSTNSASGDTISGGGCGVVKDISGKSNSNNRTQLILNIAMLLLPLFFIRLWQTLKLRWVSLFTLGIFLLLPNISFSAVNLPWSSTYNCPDWTQSNGLSTVNCDGLRGEGGWTCDNGDGTVREEQITAAANYSGGVGGKGQRHWLGDGVNNLSGGLAASFQSSQSEIWMRWYMRYEQGFEWNPYLMNQKILYFDPTSFLRLHLHYYGQDRVRIYASATGQEYPSVGNGWNTIMANGVTDARGNKTSDGQWHLWEFHVKMDTNGSDGVLELWVDQVRVINVTNANLGTTALQYVLIGSNGFTPGNGRCMFVDYDDIIISNTGPIGGSMPDKIAPSPASSLQ